MQQACGSCGRDPGAGAFCQHCGTQLAGPAGTPAPPTQPTQPAQPKGRGCRTGFLIGLLVVVGLGSVGAFLAWRYIDSEVLPNFQGVQEMTEMFETPDLVPGPPGPCFDLDVEAGLVTGWEEVSCDGPRDVESFLWAEFRDEAFPGDDYLARAAADTCEEAFALYVGTTVEESQFALDWLVPSATTWAGGDRRAACLVVSGTGAPLIGAVKGSAA